MAVVERLKDFLLSDKGRRILIALAIAAMLGLLMSTVSCGGNSSKKILEYRLERRSGRKFGGA